MHIYVYVYICKTNGKEQSRPEFTEELGNMACATLASRFPISREGRLHLKPIAVIPGRHERNMTLVIQSAVVLSTNGQCTTCGPQTPISGAYLWLSPKSYHSNIYGASRHF